jgi:hypothetical protein
MLTLIFTAGLLAPAGAATKPEMGIDLYHDCQAEVRIDDSPSPSNQDITPAQSCISYISGFIDGLALGGDNFICAESATMNTAIRVYVAYMDKNPALMDQPKWAGLYQALAVTYHCPLGQSPKSTKPKK